MVPFEDLAGAAAATRPVLALVDDLAHRGALTAPSLLPGWTRAHVVAHLAGNARSHARMLSGALEGVVADQYPGGQAAREDELQSLAADPPSAVAALHEACARLERLWRRLGGPEWARPVRPLDADPVPAAGLAWARWREVAVHGADLDAGHGPADWAPGVLERVLDDRGARLGGQGVVLVPDGWGGAPLEVGPSPRARVEGPLHDLVLWVLGRGRGRLTGDLPDLPPWR